MISGIFGATPLLMKVSELMKVKNQILLSTTVLSALISLNTINASADKFDTDFSGAFDFSPQYPSVVPNDTFHDLESNTPIWDPTDIDGDGVPNDIDSDIDGDGTPDDGDDDIDGDGILNVNDPTPLGTDQSQWYQGTVNHTTNHNLSTTSPNNATNNSGLNVSINSILSQAGLNNSDGYDIISETTTGLDQIMTQDPAFKIPDQYKNTPLNELAIVKLNIQDKNGANAGHSYIFYKLSDNQTQDLISPDVDSNDKTALENNPQAQEIMVMLNTLVWMPRFRYDNVYGESVYDWAQRQLAIPISVTDIYNFRVYTMSVLEWFTFLRTIVEQPEIYDEITLANFDNSQATGSNRHAFYTTFLHNDEIIIVYGGSQGDLEWYDSGWYNVLADTPQSIRAVWYFDDQVARFGKPGSHVYVTGHSKGAEKAQYVGILRGGQISHAYSVSGRGFSEAFVEKYAKQIDKYASKINNISANTDFVTTWGEQIAPLTLLETQSTWGILDGTSFIGLIEQFPSLYNIGSTFIGNLITQKITGTHDSVNMLKVGWDGRYHLAPVSKTGRDPYWATEEEIFKNFGGVLNLADQTYLSFVISQYFTGGLRYVHHPEIKKPATFDENWNKLLTLVENSDDLSWVQKNLYLPLLEFGFNVLLLKL